MVLATKRTATLNSVSLAVLKALRDRRYPVVTSYDLFLLLWNLFTHPGQSAPIRRKVAIPGRLQYTRLINELSAERYIRPDYDLDPPAQLIKTRLFRVSDNPDGSPEEIACLLDPFAAVSYLSAMQRYNLTDRSSVKLTLTTLRDGIWRDYARAKYISDFSLHSPASPAPSFVMSLNPIPMPQRLRGRLIENHSTIHNFESLAVVDSFARVIDIGDLFVQMLTDPTLCGGIDHVLEVWDRAADQYLESIVHAFNKTDSAIAKVRAGYILTERLGIETAAINRWASFAQRGGSRKLDPSKPYKPTYSERWMISINV